MMLIIESLRIKRSGDVEKEDSHLAWRIRPVYGVTGIYI